MDASPKIIFNYKAHKWYPPGTTFSEGSLSAKRLKTSQFYRCANSEYNILNYILRRKAIEQQDMETLKAMAAMVETTTSGTNDILGYAKNRPGSTGLWNASGDIKEKDLKDIRKELRETKSTIWSAVLSFTHEYGALYCSNKEQAHKLIGETIDKFFQASDLDPKNMSWYGAYHINTKHPHIHIIMWEKEPLRIHTKTNQPCYTDWKLPKTNSLAYRMEVSKHLNDNKLDYLPLRDELRNDLKLTLQNQLMWEAPLQRLQVELAPEGTQQYARLSYAGKKAVNHFVDQFVNSNSESKQKMDTYITSLLNSQREMVELYKENHAKPTKEVLTFAENRINELYNRLGNEVLKALTRLPAEPLESPLDEIDIERELPFPEDHILNFDNLILEDADKKILEKMCSSFNGAKAQLLYQGEWQAVRSDEACAYKTKETALLAFGNRLAFYTQDEVQYTRILASSKLTSSSELAASYNNQYAWIDRAGIYTNADSFGAVAFKISLENYNRRIALKEYDNIPDIDNLNDEDRSLLGKIKSSASGEKFNLLYESIWKTSKTDTTNTFKNIDIESLNLLSRLSFYTQDREQLERLFKASGLYRPQRWAADYKGQLDWISLNSDVYNVNTVKTVKTFGARLIDFALNNYYEKIKLPSFDNGAEKGQLAKADLVLLDRLSLSKQGAQFFQLFNSVWDNTKTDTLSTFKNFDVMGLKLCCLIARFTQDREQIERIFKASGLYRPELWNAEYKNQFSWSDKIKEIDTHGKAHKDVVLDYAVFNSNKAAKYNRQAAQRPGYIRKQSINTRKVLNTINNIIFGLAHHNGNAIDNAKRALDELRNKRKQEEREIEENEKSRHQNQR